MAFIWPPKTTFIGEINVDIFYSAYIMYKYVFIYIINIYIGVSLIIYLLMTDISNLILNMA